MNSNVIKFNFSHLFKLGLIFATFHFFTATVLFAETIKTKSLFYFDDALKVDVSGSTTSKAGTFTLKIIDPSTNKPWTDLTAQHFEGSVEMTTMDMGQTPAKVTDIEPGTIKMEAKFSMTGSWKLNITVKPTGATPETKSIEFNVK
jgi:hypothetical protein